MSNLLKNSTLALALGIFILMANPSVAANDGISSEIESLLSQKNPFGSSDAMKILYEELDYQPIWSDWYLRHELISGLEMTAWDGLNNEEYHLGAIKAQHNNYGLSEFELAYRDLMMTDALLMYREHMKNGILFSDKLKKRKKVSDAKTAIKELMAELENGTIDCYLESFRPQGNAYLTLQAMLVRYMKMAATETWYTVSDKEELSFGMEHNRIKNIRKNLTVIGELPAPKDGEYASCYDYQFYEAIRRFQMKNGLEVNGELNKKTIAALNISPSERVDQIKLNLERLRWHRAPQDETYVEVNIADYKLNYIQNGDVVNTMNVVVGKKSRKTPVFSAQMDHLVFNPTWTVPPTIKAQDVIPAVMKDPAYLNRKGMTALHNGQAVTLTADNINDYNLQSLTYRQAAGAGNALGELKFIFPNKHNVYLHDTPTKKHFSYHERAYSSGCIRVEDPRMLASWILGEQMDWTATEVKEQLAKGETKTVVLKEKMLVQIVYKTAWVDEYYNLQFRADLYDLDKQQIAKLKKVST